MNGWRYWRAFCAAISIAAATHSRVDDVHAAPLLPDLTAWANEANDYMYDGVINKSLVPGKTVYQFIGALPNIGAGPLEVRVEELTDGSQNVYQRIHDSGGGVSEVPIGNFADAASLPPRRLFLPGIARYNLRTVLAANGVGPIVSSWDKTSMALVDGKKYDSPPPGTPASPVYNSISASVQGVSVGWADIYGRFLPGQWADATGLPNGEYWLEVVADPENRIQESDETNNATRIKVQLVIPPPTLRVGEYNGEDLIDAADYTVWRDTLGAIVPMGAGADGDLSGKIGLGDYLVWKENFDPGYIEPAARVPEPAGVALVASACCTGFCWLNRGRRNRVVVQLGA